MTKRYDAADIEVLSGLEPVRRRPGMYTDTSRPNHLAHEVVDLYRAQESSVTISVQVDPTMPKLEADIGRIRQILHNLIRNATEALENTRDGRIELHVSLAEIGGVDVVQIRVEDNGPGFQEGAVSQVFDPYVTTKTKGTGLGLAIVKKLVEEHMGTIRAYNNADGGAVISIRLPLNEAAREAIIANAPRRAEQRREEA